MKIGKVKYYNDSKGYGFISDQNGDDFFVHCSCIGGDKNTLKVGDRVRFDVEPGEKGLRAVDVVLAE